MTNLEKDIREYFSKCFDNGEEIIEEFNEKTLTFSYLLGMYPEECRYMEVETDWTAEDIRQYDEIESIIYKIKLEKYRQQ